MKDSQTRLFAWEQAVLHSDLPPPQKLILLTLRTFCRPGKPECWPSIATISALTSLSRRTVQRHIHNLTHQKWLISTQKDATGTYHKAPTYTLRLPRGGRHSDTPPCVTVTPEETILREKPDDPHNSCQEKEPERGNTDPESIRSILEGVNLTPDETELHDQRLHLLDRFLAYENGNPKAEKFWIRRLYDLEKAGKIAQALSILDYCEMTQSPHMRESKGLGEINNPAAWLNKRTLNLLTF